MKKDELANLEVIRVETALSRFPIHRLAKSGAVRIELQEEDERGATTLKWRVSYNNEFGQPGPLAYKLDTLIINRKIEAAGRPTPKVVKLGSLREIADATGTGDGNTTTIKRALHQNASAYITAKIRYRTNDGTERRIEVGDTRYAVVFTGEELPDGRTADAVYIVLHDFYRKILDTALTRPLDYQCLRDLAPVPQRLYELLSYRMYAALKNGLSKAKLGYAEFCLHAPQTRYVEFDRVKKQMHKIHATHRQSGYITRVEFEATTDRDGRPDWMMLYTPGPKAKAEFGAFTRKGGPVASEAEPAQPESEPEPAGLVKELIDRGVTKGVAAELVRDFSKDQIRIQIANLDGRRRKVKDPGAWLPGAIRKGFALPTPPVGPVPVAKDTEARRAEGSRATWDPEDDLLSEADLAHWRRAAAGGDRVQTNLARIILAKHEQAEAAIRRP
jgi:hypothetical protein